MPPAGRASQSHGKRQFGKSVFMSFAANLSLEKVFSLGILMPAFPLASNRNARAAGRDPPIMASTQRTLPQGTLTFKSLFHMNLQCAMDSDSPQPSNLCGLSVPVRTQHVPMAEGALEHLLADRQDECSSALSEPIAVIFRKSRN